MTHNLVQPWETMSLRGTISSHGFLSQFGEATSVVPGNPASAAWPLANLALFVPFQVPQTCVVYRIAVPTGATAGGNFDFGIYDLAGALLQSTGTTGRTANNINLIDWTDLTLTPGQYYMALSADGTNNYFGIAPAAGLCRSIGIGEQTSAFVLPSSATIAATTRAYVPLMHMQLRSTAI